MNDDVLKEVIVKNGSFLQMVVAIEEMSELMKELSKSMRGENNHDAILEELADVYIMLKQIEMINDITKAKLFEKITEKIDRLKERINHESV